MKEMIEHFSFDSVHTSAAVFDPDKLSWLNEHYIKNTPPEELVPHLEPCLISAGVLQEGHGLGVAEIAKVIPSLNQRAKTLVEMAAKSAFYFKKEVEFDEKAKTKFLTRGGQAIAGKNNRRTFSVGKLFCRRRLKNCSKKLWKKRV